MLVQLDKVVANVKLVIVQNAIIINVLCVIMGFMLMLLKNVLDVQHNFMVALLVLKMEKLVTHVILLNNLI